MVGQGDWIKAIHIPQLLNGQRCDRTLLIFALRGETTDDDILPRLEACCELRKLTFEEAKPHWKCLISVVSNLSAMIRSHWAISLSLIIFCACERDALLQCRVKRPGRSHGSRCLISMLMAYSALPPLQLRRRHIPLGLSAQDFFLLVNCKRFLVLTFCFLIDVQLLIWQNI